MPIKAEQLRQFVNPGVTFVETGTNYGDGVLAAIEAGFDNIISIEIDSILYQNARRIFSDYEQVTIYNGNSPELLELLEPHIKKAVFWLDAHQDSKTPILAELEAIKHRKGDIVLVDDYRYFCNGHWGGRKQVESTFESFRFIDGHCKDDILVGIL